eukprot:1148712-Pyramimonas_sp.AAC.1
MPRDPKKKAAKKKARKQVPTCPCRNVRVIRVGFREVALEGDFCFTFVSTGDVRNRLLPSRGLQAKIAQNAAADEEEMEMEGDEEERPRPSGRRRRLLPWGNCNMFTTSHIAPFRLQKLVFARVWQPGMEGETDGPIELEYDPSAYDCLHAFRLEWPCLSFDILRDNLGEARDQWPHSMFMVAGTQAANPKSNSIALMRITSISKTHKPPKVWLSSRGILSAYDLLLSARGMRHRSYRFRVVDFVHHKAGPCCILGFYGKPIGTCRRPRTTMTTTIPRTRIATRTWTRMSRPGPGSLQASRGHQFCTSARWRTAQASTACAAAHRLRSSSPASPTMPTCR